MTLSWVQMLQKMNVQVEPNDSAAICWLFGGTTDLGPKRFSRFHILQWKQILKDSLRI